MHAETQAASAAAATAVARPESPPLLDRETSLLAFNERVLAQARRPSVRLLERLRYITIVSSNLDEFFEVRFSTYLDSVREEREGPARQAFEALAAHAHRLIDEQYRILNDEVMPALARQGLRVINHAERNAAQRRWVARYFEHEVRPLLVPVALDPAHPFPVVANKSLNFILHLAEGATPTRSNGDGDASLAQNPLSHRSGTVVIVRVPRALPRVIRLPNTLVAAGEQAFVLLTSVIRAHLAQLLPGRTVKAFSQFRVTRDSELEVDEDELTNLRQALRTGLSTRHYGEAIRLEVVASCPPELTAFLLEQFDLPPAALYAVNGPVNLVRLNELINLADGAGLRFPPFEPGWPSDALPRDVPIFETLKQRDLLLHHPFQSFEPVVQFLREAVLDPNVLAIKQTIYRTGFESVLMDLLMEAVRRGKEVTVVLELKARFDEETNINWAERLEAVGVQVVYGLVGLKTHAKMLLVTRREKSDGFERRPGKSPLHRYAHLSTGNYNPKTALLYTDLGLITADPALCADIDAVFMMLASLAPVRTRSRLLVAPTQLQTQMLAHLAQVAAAARAGQPARVVIKLNALTDPTLIDALLAAGQAGAWVDLIVRGACMLRPGVPGTSERIRVRSVIGRFLEHTRILYFCWGTGQNDEVLYLSSADWMTRNMLRRVEVAWPIRDRALRQRVIDECLVPYLMDAQDAWELGPDGQYRAVPAVGPGAQAALMLALGKTTPD